MPRSDSAGPGARDGSGLPRADRPDPKRPDSLAVARAAGRRADHAREGEAPRPSKRRHGIGCAPACCRGSTSHGRQRGRCSTRSCARTSSVSSRRRPPPPRAQACRASSSASSAISSAAARSTGASPDHALCRAVLGVFIRAVLGWYRRRGRRGGVPDGQSGTVTVVQRFGSGLELNVHFHALSLDGVFAPGADGTLRFHRLPPPSEADVARLVATIARRVGRLLVRRGLADDADAVDPLAAESPALAGLASAAVQGRVALEPRAGARVARLGADPDAPWVESSQPLQARCEGFDLHSAVTVAGEDRERLEQLCRYLLRPPIAQERLALRSDGTVLVTLKTPWRDGTTHLCFEPVTLLERLAALTPRPRINVVLYHGVLAPRARWRAAAVAYGRAEAPATSNDAALIAGPAGPAAGPSAAADVSAATAPEPEPASPQPSDPAAGAAPPRRWRWAELLQRVFAVDVLACPSCGGRMRLIATIEDPRVVRRILTHLGLAGDEHRPADLADP